MHSQQFATFKKDLRLKKFQNNGCFFFLTSFSFFKTVSNPSFGIIISYLVVFSLISSTDLRSLLFLMAISAVGNVRKRKNDLLHCSGSVKTTLTHEFIIILLTPIYSFLKNIYLPLLSPFVYFHGNLLKNDHLEL